jgi:hypothetical protein
MTVHAAAALEHGQPLLLLEPVELLPLDLNAVLLNRYASEE